MPIIPFIDLYLSPRIYLENNREGKSMEHLGRRTIQYACLLLALYVLFFLFIDAPVDRWVSSNFGDTWLFRTGKVISDFANGEYLRLGLALCFILVLIADPSLKKPWVRGLAYICISCAIALVVGEGLKYLLARHRPVMLFQHGEYGLSFFSSEWAENSSPSGHTLRAFSILTALSMLRRKWTWLFITIAALIGISRVLVTDHYPSDVLFGAYIGIFSALWVYKFYYGRNDHPGSLDGP